MADNQWEFGSRTNTNVRMPSGNLGVSEHRHRFSIEQSQRGIDAVLTRETVLREESNAATEQPISYSAQTFGPFPTQAEAEKFVNGYIADYMGVADDFNAAGVEHQAEQYEQEMSEDTGYGMEV